MSLAICPLERRVGVRALRGSRNAFSVVTVFSFSCPPHERRARLSVYKSGPTRYKVLYSIYASFSPRASEKHVAQECAPLHRRVVQRFLSSLSGEDRR